MSTLGSRLRSIGEQREQRTSSEQQQTLHSNEAPHRAKVEAAKRILAARLIAAAQNSTVKRNCFKPNHTDYITLFEVECDAVAINTTSGWYRILRDGTPVKEHFDSAGLRNERRVTSSAYQKFIDYLKSEELSPFLIGDPESEVIFIDYGAPNHYKEGSYSVETIGRAGRYFLCVEIP